MKGPVVLFVGDALAGQSGLPVLRLACMSVGHEAVGRAAGSTEFPGRSPELAVEVVGGADQR